MTFANKIKKLRKLAGCSQNALSKLLRVSQCSVSNWESGRNEADDASCKKLEKFCNKKGFNIKWR